MRRLLVALVAGLAGLTAVPSATAATDAPMLLGLAEGGDWRAELDHFTGQQGKAPAIYQIYFEPSLFGEVHQWPGGILSDLHGRGITGWIEWTTDDLDAMASGAQDDAIRNFWDSIDGFLTGGPSRSVLVAPLPEANLDEHAWSRDPVAYQKAFRRMRELAAEFGLGPQHVRFVFSMNGYSTQGRAPRQFYPGDEHVDVVAFARLNRGSFVGGWRDYADVFGGPLADLRAQIGTHKPIMVAQTASVTAGGDRAQWLRDMFAGLRSADGVIGAVYWNRDRGHDFRVHSHPDSIPLDPDFKAGYDTWSDPSAADWLFDGGLDNWVEARGGTASTWPPSTDDPPPAVNVFGKDLAVTPRVGTGAPGSNAIAISQARFAPDAARHVVLSRDDAFPDALAGTPLLGDGPLLLTPTASLPGAVRAELDRVLPAGATVYLLGGPAALAPGIEDSLVAAGYDVRRLAGDDRFETSVEIAEEVAARYPSSADRVLVARGFGVPGNPTAAWADSVTGGGFAAWSRHPVILSESGRLPDDAAAFLDGRGGAVLLGGVGALNDTVAAQVDQRVGSVARMAGAARDGTAQQIMTTLWGRPLGEFRMILIDGYGELGWAFGLPAAGLSADFEAPLLPVAQGAIPDATTAALRSCFSKRIASVVVGAANVVSDGIVAAIEQRDHSC